MSLLLAIGGAGSANITGAGNIASSEAFGSSTVSAVVESSGIVTAEQIGTASVLAIIDAIGIDTAEAYGSPAVLAPSAERYAGGWESYLAHVNKQQRLRKERELREELEARQNDLERYQAELKQAEETRSDYITDQVLELLILIRLQEEELIKLTLNLQRIRDDNERSRLAEQKRRRVAMTWLLAAA